jgi:predicted nicotinamide N-methyase
MLIVDVLVGAELPHHKREEANSFIVGQLVKVFVRLSPEPRNVLIIHHGRHELLNGRLQVLKDRGPERSRVLSNLNREVCERDDHPDRCDQLAQISKVFECHRIRRLRARG